MATGTGDGEAARGSPEEGGRARGRMTCGREGEVWAAVPPLIVSYETKRYLASGKYDGTCVRSRLLCWARLRPAAGPCPGGFGRLPCEGRVYGDIAQQGGRAPMYMLMLHDAIAGRVYSWARGLAGATKRAGVGG